MQERITAGQPLELLSRRAGVRGRARISITLALWLFAIGIGQVALWPRLPELSPALVLGYSLLILAVLTGPLVHTVLRRARAADSVETPQPSVWGKAVATMSRAARLADSWRWFSLLILPFLIGSGWALYWDRVALDSRLPDTQHGRDFDVSLQIISLPETRPAAYGRERPGASIVPLQDIHFLAEVVSATDPSLEGRRLRLAWYATARAAEIRGGSFWQMRLRLKQPRGTVNPHTFDYEAWLLQQGVYATGYVRDQQERPTRHGYGGGMLAVREQIRQRLRAAGLSQEGLLLALLLGDRSGTSTADETLLRNTGTSHLLAISGLHVGMVAGFCLLLGGLLSRSLGLWRAHNPRLLAGLCSISGAAAYVLLCGAPLSAQRALIMLAVLLAAWIWRRRISGALAFAVALALVLLVQPLAVLGAGFWLSFGAVAALLLRFSGRRRLAQTGPLQSDGRPPALLTRFADYLHAAFSSQWVIALALLLPSMWFFSGVSVTGLLVNLLAIPWMGISILPSILLAPLLPGPQLATWAWQFADWQLRHLLEFFAVVDGAASNWYWLSPPSLLPGALALMSVALLLLPRGLPGRGLGWVLLPAVIATQIVTPAVTAPALRTTVLDVGQGLAVVVDTGEQSLVIDTGADSNAGWSAGREIVAPFLLGEGVSEIDALVVSHGDRDHAGGAAGLVERIPVLAVHAPGLLGQQLARRFATHLPAELHVSPCIAGHSLSLRDLNVTWLWPPEAADESVVSGEENDHSCVALVEWERVRILVTGDISRRVERQLAQSYPGFSAVDLLIAPHHGSRTSSSNTLIQWARPANVVFSAGYRHHFGHPHPAVMARYRRSGARLFNTANMGAISFAWLRNSLQPQIECARDRGRFWLATAKARGCLAESKVPLSRKKDP